MATPSQLQDQWRKTIPASQTNDYVLLCAFGNMFAARSRDGTPAVVIQLADRPSATVGRRGAGLDLLPYAALRFAHRDSDWTAPAVALVCLDLDALDAFSILVSDVARRLGNRIPCWSDVAAIVEEWQRLLARSARPTMEVEMGLWGELWLLTNSHRPDDILAGWRGPDREAFDFFLDGSAVEVKTSRLRRIHHVSHRQISQAAGDNPSWLLSLWVGVDPIRGVAVPALVDKLTECVSDPVGAMRKVIAAGYSPIHRAAYETKFITLGQPEWYPTEIVPRVRLADPGVSRLRYMVNLDETASVSGPAAAILWQRFLGYERETHG